MCFHSWVKQKSLAAHFLPVKLISMNTIIAKKLSFFGLLEDSILTCGCLMDRDSLFNTAEAKKLLLDRDRTKQTSPSNYPFPILPAVSFRCITGSPQNNCFFAIYKFICTHFIDQNESGKRKQSKPKLKASLNVKIGRGIANICF